MSAYPVDEWAPAPMGGFLLFETKAQANSFNYWFLSQDEISGSWVIRPCEVKGRAIQPHLIATSFMVDGDMPNYEEHTEAELKRAWKKRGSAIGTPPPIGTVCFRNIKVMKPQGENQA